MDYSAEVFDQFQQLCDFKGFNGHQVHCVLRFEYLPDAGILKKAKTDPSSEGRFRGRLKLRVGDTRSP